MPCKILLVDDDADIVTYLSALLEDHGYVVQTASDACVALSALERYEPHAILVDVMMPGRSGLDLLVTLRAHPRWHDLYVVLITGNEQVIGDACRSYLAAAGGLRGADQVLGKPVDHAALLKALRPLST